MRYAETGFNLEVDLTRGNIEKVATNPRYQLYLGGGLGHECQDFVGSRSLNQSFLLKIY